MAQHTKRDNPYGNYPGYSSPLSTTDYSRHGSDSPYSNFDARHTSSRKRKPHSRRKFVILGVAVGAVAILGSAAGIVAHQGLGLIDNTKVKASELASTANQLVESVKEADFTQANILSKQLSSQTTDLQTVLNNGLVGIAENLTSYDTDIKAARRLLGSLRTVADNALTPLTETLSRYSMDTLLINSDGTMQVNTAAVQDIINSLLAALPSIKECLSSVDSISDNLHVEQLSNAVNLLREANDSYGALFEYVEEVLPLIPGILGAYGPRTYLIIAQTNSEIASTGGFPGAMGFATMDQGRFEMSGFDSVFKVIPRLETPLPITDEERALYDDAIGYATDAMGHNPDFPRAAELWAQACEQVNGFMPSGVIALDPVFLQEMLALTGTSIPMSDGSQIDGSNAAQTLLNDVYWRYLSDSSAQDAYFSEAASNAADAIIQALPTIDASKLLETIVQGFENRRLNLWLADPAEENRLINLNLDNGVQGTVDIPELGIYLTDAIWSKIEWYLNMHVQLNPEIQVEGSRAIPTEVAFTNTITYEAAWAANGNAYIVGYNEDIKREDGDMGFLVFLYAPLGGNILNFACEPTPSGYVPDITVLQHYGRWVIKSLIKILPGETITLRFDTILPANCPDELRIDMTPLGQAAIINKA